MAYILVNKDNTVCAVEDEPIEQDIPIGDVKTIEIPNKTAAEVLSGIKREEAYWDGSKVIRDPIFAGLSNTDNNITGDKKEKLKALEGVRAPLDL